MKNYFLLICLSLSTISSLSAQNKLPNIPIETLSGEQINASDLSNNGNPIIVSFWATWCKPCISELEAINDIYEELQAETGVKVIAISVDDARSYAKVKAIAFGNDWPFEMYFDKNQNLKRALNVLNIPHTFLLNGKGEIVWQKNGYMPGDEDELFEIIVNPLNH